jgi:hypothetical protein
MIIILSHWLVYIGLYTAESWHKISDQNKHQRFCCEVYGLNYCKCSHFSLTAKQQKCPVNKPRIACPGNVNIHTRAT